MISRVGEVSYNKTDEKMIIIGHESEIKVIIRFEDGTILSRSYTNFKTGCIRNPNHKSFYEVATLGEGKYRSRENGKLSRKYYVWHGMLERCYSELYKKKNKNTSYLGCTVCDEWLNFQNFAKWYEENYYDVGVERMHIDKDILVRGNKIYSPETCIFVPQSINSLFINYSKQNKMNEILKVYESKMPSETYKKLESYMDIEKKLYEMIIKDDFSLICNKCKGKISVKYNEISCEKCKKYILKNINVTTI